MSVNSFLWWFSERVILKYFGKWGFHNPILSVDKMDISMKEVERMIKLIYSVAVSEFYF